VRHTVKTVNNMTTSKINLGTKVFNKKNQEGTITKVITKSTGYVEVTYINGLVKKEMAFNLTDETGNSLKATPKAQKRTITTADRIESTKQELLRVNEYRYDNLVKVYMSALDKVHTENKFIDSLIDTFAKATIGIAKLSEKQAYYLAKFVVENNI
jgi:hypothetical protein